jgi:predicted transcriptional regulator
MTDLFSTPPHKLYRKDDPDTSKEAAEALDVTAMESIVADAIWQFGEKGCISDEVVDALPAHRYNSITPRFKALKEKGIVIIDNSKRKGRSGRGQHVMWHKEFYHESE